MLTAPQALKANKTNLDFCVTKGMPIHKGYPKRSLEVLSPTTEFIAIEYNPMTYILMNRGGI
jgi:hypothetical protein